MSSLTTVEVAAYVAAGALSLSKAFSAAQPIWAKLPKWAALALPVLVLDLPQVAAYFGACAHATQCTSVDLITALVTSAALLLPGIQHAEAPAPPAGK